MAKTLIVIDMQNDFIYGPLGTEEARAIVPNVKKKIEEYRDRGDNVWFTMDSHFNDYFDTHEGRYLPVEHCRFGTAGWAIINDIPSYGHERTCKSTFGVSWWGFGCLQNIVDTQIELVGVCTDICVVSNALMLRSTHPELDITVDASCCAGTTPEMHKAALAVMKSCHIDIINE
jgi:nicotinamidase-related amidase